eukprot:5677194-Ditylum_brightwellii.AAC.1
MKSAGRHCGSTQCPKSVPTNANTPEETRENARIKPKQLHAELSCTPDQPCPVSSKIGVNHNR